MSCGLLKDRIRNLDFRINPNFSWYFVMACPEHREKVKMTLNPATNKIWTNMGSADILMLGITPHFWVLKIDSISIVSSQFGFVIGIP
jgi:hypothetical protein